MKKINLISLIQSFESLNNHQFTIYKKLYDIEIKDQEVLDLKSLISKILKCEYEYKIFNGFNIGYKIPQISKEFDLLRFGKKSIINIELKRVASKEKILKQLLRNRYYLKFLEKELITFCYISSSKTIFQYDGENLFKISKERFIKILSNQTLSSLNKIDDLFDPTNYLVSPFNSTQKFIEREYFLTNQQQEIKDKTLKLFESIGPNFVSIEGKAGTGKTLLVYDIAISFMEKAKKVTIVHVGQINDGQSRLTILHGFNIVSIKNYYNEDFAKNDLVIIDESQRIKPSQLDEIIKRVKNNKLNCIFSYDGIQCLKSTEIKNKIPSKIYEIPNIKLNKLTEKIRTNKEIAIFIKLLLNKHRKLDLVNKGNIEVIYFSDSEKATQHLMYLQQNNWTIINYTPSRYNKYISDEYHLLSTRLNAHKVIGQEFDNIVAVIDKDFYYNQDGRLSTDSNAAYYHKPQMLFQILTRVRKKLFIVIIDNPEVTERCSSILISDK